MVGRIEKTIEFYGEIVARFRDEKCKERYAECRNLVKRTEFEIIEALIKSGLRIEELGVTSEFKGSNTLVKVTSGLPDWILDEDDVQDIVIEVYANDMEKVREITDMVEMIMKRNLARWELANS